MSNKIIQPVTHPTGGGQKNGAVPPTTIKPAVPTPRPQPPKTSK